jgi:hypothetical protein
MDEKTAEKVLEMRSSGMTFKKIGEHFGVGVERARQMEISANRIMKERTNPDCWWYGLSVRTSNCLKNADIESKQEALDAFKCGKLNPRMGGTKNYGWKCHKELADWLGLPEPKKGSPKYVEIKGVADWSGKNVIDTLRQFREGKIRFDFKNVTIDENETMVKIPIVKIMKA